MVETSQQIYFLAAAVVGIGLTILGFFLREAIATSIQSQLLRLNSEFANYVPVEYQMPQVALAPTGDPDYFPIGVKHRYTRGGVTPS